MSRHAALPLLGHVDMSLDPQQIVLHHLQRPVMLGREVRGDDLPSRRSRLEAEVHVVAVAQRERLVETEIAHGPRREHHQKSIHGVHLTRGGRAILPGERRKDTPAELLVVLSHPTGADVALPPGDGPHPGGPDCPDHRDVRITQCVSHLRAEVGVDDPGVWMHQYESLEVIVLPRGLEQEVVGPRDLSDSGEDVDLRVGLLHRVDARLGVEAIRLSLPHGYPEGDHCDSSVGSRWRSRTRGTARRRSRLTRRSGAVMRHEMLSVAMPSAYSRCLVCASDSSNVR